MALTDAEMAEAETLEGDEDPITQARLSFRGAAQGRCRSRREAAVRACGGGGGSGGLEALHC